jgi:precorrin-6x reductase
MILVFGGTTEGRKTMALLEQAGLRYCYSTKTEVEMPAQTCGSYRHGAMSHGDLREFCESNSVRVIVHAGHPFAVELHETIAGAGLPVLRFERAYPVRMAHALVHYFDDYVEVIAYLLAHPVRRLLALTGVQTIDRLKGYWTQHPVVFRILPRKSSLEMARRTGFPEELLIREMPGNEAELIQQYGITGILTKESGESGLLSVKISEALAAGIPIFIIRRPVMPVGFVPVGEEDLLTELNKHLV